MTEEHPGLPTGEALLHTVLQRLAACRAVNGGVAGTCPEVNTAVVGDMRITYPVATTVTYQLAKDDDA